MSGQNERTPLLGNGNAIRVPDGASVIWRNASSEQYEVDDGDEIDEDTLNHMMARFGSSVGSLGLGGAIQGTPMMRRGSISTAMRRPSLARRPSRPVQEDHSIQSPDITVDQRTRRDSSSRAPQGDIFPQKWSGVSSSVRRVASIDDSEIRAPEKRSKYLGGVSEARFWAVFSSILLVYFVTCFDSTLMASSHPVITSYFHSSNSASWLSTSFLLTSTTFQPVFGRLSDQWSQQAKPNQAGPPAWFGLAVKMAGLVWFIFGLI